MPTESLRHLLNQVGRGHNPRGLVIYPFGDTTTSQNNKYGELREIAIRNSPLLIGTEGFSRASVTLLHFNNHLDNIT